MNILNRVVSFKSTSQCHARSGTHRCTGRSGPRVHLVLALAALAAGFNTVFADYEYISHFGVGGSPAQVSFDSQGNLLIADTGNNLFRNCDLAGVCTNINLTMCIPPEFDDAWGVAQYDWGWIVLTDAFGDAVYVCDGNNLITGQAYEEQGNGSGQFLLPRQVAVNTDGDIFVADSGNERIQIRDTAGGWSSIGGTRGVPPETGRFWEPSGVAVARNGNIVVADKSNDRIQVCSAEATDPGNCIAIGERGTEIGQFMRPQGVAIDNAGRIIVADTNNNRLQICGDPVCNVIDGSCQICDTLDDWTIITGSVAGDFEWPVSVATDRRGNLAVAEYSSDRVQVFGDPGLFPINPGLNDHWFDPKTTGQGAYITVFPILGRVNMTMFTYDTELPPGGIFANLGNMGQRWLNGLGRYAGNQATLKLSYNYDGLFDSTRVTTKVNDYGTAILTFTSCNSGTIEYDIPSLGLTGTIPIQRIVDDNALICEAFLAGISPW